MQHFNVVQSIIISPKSLKNPEAPDTKIFIRKDEKSGDTEIVINPFNPSEIGGEKEMLNTIINYYKEETKKTNSNLYIALYDRSFDKKILTDMGHKLDEDTGDYGLCFVQDLGEHEPQRKEGECGFYHEAYRIY